MASDSFCETCVKKNLWEEEGKCCYCGRKHGKADDGCSPEVISIRRKGHIVELSQTDGLPPCMKFHS